MKNPSGSLSCSVAGAEACRWCYELMHVEDNNPAIVEVISMEGSDVVESSSCQIQALIKCLGLVKKRRKIREKWLTEQKSAVPVCKLPVLWC